MAIDVKRMVRKHGALVSAVTALSVTAFILALKLLSSLISWVSVLPLVAAQQGGLFDASSVVGSVVGQALLTAIPFGIGFFLSLWLVAPIAEELRVGHVITRAVLATGIGSTVLFIVAAIIGLIGAFQPGGDSIAGYAFPWPQFSGDNAVFALGQALGSGLQALIGLLPLGVLAGVLLWLWRKDHPPKHPLAGYIDEI